MAMIHKSLIILIALLQLLPLNAQQNWQDTEDTTSPDTNDAPRRRATGGSGAYHYKTALTSPELEPARLLRARPNAQNNGLVIEFELEDPAAVRFQLLDTRGKIVWETTEMPTLAFRQTDTRPTGNLTPGMYTLRMMAGGQKLGQCAVVVPAQP